MSHFNFQNLAPDEFEALAKDVMQRLLGIRLFRYAPGQDGGIDLCNNISTNETVVQCKRYEQGQFQNLAQRLREEKMKLESLDPSPQKYYVFTSLALLANQKKRIFDLFKDYMESEANIVDRVAIEDFFDDLKNHDLIPKHKKLFESYPEGYDPNVSRCGVLQEQETSIRELLTSIAEGKKEQIRTNLLFPWFADSAQYYEVFPELFVDPCLKNNKTRKTVLDIVPFLYNNLMILGEAGAGKTTFLKIWFAYKDVEKSEAKDTVVMFYHASAFSETESELVRCLELARKDPDTHYLFLIDGIDEAFNNSHQSYCSFISKLKVGENCNYWLGCRRDFYNNHVDERTKISDFDLTIEQWNEKQINSFIRIYSTIRKSQGLPDKIARIIERAPDSNSIERMLHNPFQLSILTFLAEEFLKTEEAGQTEVNIVCGVYDLYEQFINYWIRHEKGRGTSPSPERQISVALHDAARNIYMGEDYVFDEIAGNNTAVNGLLKIKRKRIDGRFVSNEFYHRSLAEFLLANEAFQSIFDNDGKLFALICKIKLKDDITNFICDKFSSLSINERKRIKRNLWGMYRETLDAEESLSVREQIIYFITRLEIDVSDFIQEVKASPMNHTMIRMTLAYGCALQEDVDTRRFALEFARAIAEHPQGDEAVVNRAWPVIYYGDLHSEELDVDEYLYRDTLKGSWEKVRKSRVDRFKCAHPRRKDIRFLILDIPLFHNFLIDRNWDHISREEYHVLQKLSVDSTLYSEEEKRFLANEKEKLLQEYKDRLSK